MTRTPKSLYVHIPWCASKCPYCAFNSQAGATPAEIETYLDALLREFDLLDGGRPLELETIYVGGGTPTVLQAPELERLLLTIRRRIDPRVVREWTVEANPGTVTGEHLEVLRASGVGRISMGVQSLDPGTLRSLGRIHTAEEVRETVSAFQDHGFTNINLDLIYGLPGQALSGWRSDLEGVLDLNPQHLSLYALQFEEGTAYGRAHAQGRMQELPENEVLGMFRSARQLLAGRGFSLYEISNFARPGWESHHNQTYWRNEPYYGIGAGAYARSGHRRTRNESNAGHYARRILDAGSAVAEEDVLGPVEDYVETLTAGLRTTAGVDLRELAVRTGLDALSLHAVHLQRLQDSGLATLDGTRLVLTEDGLWVLDSILEPFLDLGGMRTAPADVACGPRP